MMNALRAVLTAMIFLGCFVGASAQEADAPAPVTAAVADPFGRGTPRGTVLGFLDAMANEDTAKASQYLDLSAAAQAASGERLARDLQTVMTRNGRLTPTVQIANVPGGREGDGLAVDVDKVGTLGRGRDLTDLLLTRGQSGDGVAVWRVSAETLKQVPHLLRVSDRTVIETWLPDWLSAWKLLGVSAADWIAMIAVAAIMLGSAYLLTFALVYIFILFWSRSRPDRTGTMLRSVRLPLAVILASRWFNTATATLGVSVAGREMIGRVVFIVSTIAVAWLLWRLVDGLSRLVLYRMSYRGQASALSAVNLARRALKAGIAFVGALAMLDIMGFDVTAGLAALGIGGLAVALGAQKTVENLVGSVTLVADRPVHVGDFCRFGDESGTVEDIGMRSTRIRTMQRTVVTVPNGALSAMQIENYSQRDRFEFKHVLTLRYETTPAMMRDLLERLRALLEDHPSVRAETPRVRFIGLGPSALDVEVFAYIEVTDLGSFLGEQEYLLLRMMEIVEECGSGFAFPSRTLYVAGGGDAPPPGKGEEPQISAEAP